MFLQCPQKYKFYYIDKLAYQYKIPRPYLIMGEHVHGALKDFFKLPVEKRSLEMLHQRLRYRWKQKREAFLSIEEEKEWGEKALKMLTRFYQNQNIFAKPFRLEERQEVKIGHQIILEGKIDRIDLDEKGFLWIIDYKTGREPSQNENDTFLKEDLQLIIYSYIVYKTYKKPVKQASYLYLQTNKLISIEPTPERLIEGLAKVREIIECIMQEKEFQPKVNRFCRICDFIAICSKRDEIETDIPFIEEDETPFPF